MTKEAALRVIPVPVDATALALLPRTRMCDAYRVIVDDATIDAAEAVQRMFGRVPSWVRALMRLRNGLAKPLGLKCSCQSIRNGRE
jgi:hypothetical protein